MTITVDKVKRLVWRLTKKAAILLGALALLVVGLAYYAWNEIVEPRWSEFGTIPDEAKRANMTRQQFPAANDEYFVKMDKGWLIKPGSPGENKDGQEWIAKIAKEIGRTEEEVRKSSVRGQNGWLVWTGGNDRFWDYAANHTGGAFDLLKVLSSYKDDKHPENSMYYGRHNRWHYLGLVNEPCFKEAAEADASRYGLWLDRRETNDADCRKDPFADETRYPGAKVGARGRTVPVGSHYGEPSGIIGLRLFPNPDFDEEAARKWDPVRYYTDPYYFNDPKLVRPYRVGMACAFCHVGPNPINPPENPEEPKWENLSSNPGAQYYWVDRIFVWNTKPRDRYTNAPTFNEGNFLFQIFHTNPPGSLDTSFVSTDYMNNPRTMNAVYDTFERLILARKTGRELLKGGERDNKQFGDYPLTTALADYWDQRTGAIHTMRVLKDGSDSVGALGALNRVYLNIGLFSEEWLLHFRGFVGGRKITPIKIADAQKQSVYWQATEDMTPHMAMFFLTTARADKLKDAPKGNDYLKDIDSDVVNRGKVVFAENCAACHSSTNKLPQPPANSGIDAADCDGGGNGPNYRQCWDRYWQWTQTADFKQKTVEKVMEKDFLEGNYLSNERRVPLDLLQVNACGPLASNALRDDIWDNFSSDTYKSLPPPKETTIYHPESGAAMPLQIRGNGRGYLRPASLISLWSTAPYLSNNSVGHKDDYNYGYDYAATCPSAYPDDPYLPCVENRMRQFDRSIHEMLYPDRRRMDPIAKTPGYMYRTSAPSCVKWDGRAFSSLYQKLSGVLHWALPWAIDEKGDLALGPLPKDFPINALLNTKLLPDNDEPMLPHLINVAKATPTLLKAFKGFGGACKPQQLADPGTQYRVEAVVRETRLIDTLVGISKCPDYVVNRGHYFGADLPDAAKEDLIEYLKHF